MNRILLAVALAALPALALADPCDTKEYAQYKDEGATAYGRGFMALHYCTLGKMVKIERTNVSTAGELRVSRCQAEQAKIMQVLASKNDRTAQDYALGGCVGPIPSPKAKK